MRKRKTRLECLTSTSLNITEISTLLNTSKPKAKKIFTLAMKEDIDLFGGVDRLIENDKVTIGSVLKVSHTSYNLLAKQIKNADALPSNPQTI